MPILAPLLGGLVLAVAGWRGIFWVLTSFGVAVGIAVLFGLRESRTEETAAVAAAETPFQTYALLLKERRLLGYMLAGGFNSACLFTYIALSPELVIGRYGIDAQHFGWIFGINAAALIGASQINRILLRRWTSDRVLAAATTAVVGFGAILATAGVSGIGGMWAVLVPLFFVVGSFGFIFANSAAGALSVDPLRSGSVSALTGASGFIIGALVSVVAGLLPGGPAAAMGVTMFVAVCLSAMSLFLLALRPAPSAA